MVGRKKKPPELFEENVRLKDQVQKLEGANKIQVTEEETDNGYNERSFKIRAFFKKNCGRISLCFFILVLITVLVLVLTFQYLSSMSIFPILSKDGIHLNSDPFTIGKIEGRDIELCHGNQMKRSFPDFDYATYGYNIIHGYPLATGHDPGLTHPIFEADYSRSGQTADCRYQVPRGYHLAPDVACVTSFSSETVKDSRQFSKHLSASAEVSGGGWGVSFSASTEYKKKSSTMAASESVFIFSKAVCNYYFALLNEQDPPPLSIDFINVAKSIKTQDDLFKFFDYYGTHFLKYTLFGARFIYEYKMSQKSYQSESSEELSVSAKASYSGMFSLSGGFGMSSGNSQKAQSFLSKVETKTISIGAPPPSNGDTMTWASTVKDTPIPVQMKLESMENLFTERYMKDYQFDYSQVKQLIEDGKSSYCQHLKAKGVVDTCKMLSTYTTFADMWINGGVKYTYNENQCIDRCLDDNLCYAIHHFDSNICYIYRINNTMYRGEKKDGSKVIIFFDNLELLKYTFKLQDVRIKSGINARNKYARNSETACLQECQDDAICSLYTFKSTAKADETNCWLYNWDKIQCQGGTEANCNTLSIETGFVTRFNPV